MEKVTIKLEYSQKTNINFALPRGHSNEFGESSNGRSLAFGTMNLGSNPSSPAMVTSIKIIIMTKIELARGVSIYTILGKKGNGRMQKVICQFHDDHNPSLCIYPQGTFHCYSCGAHGNNAIDFAMLMGNTFLEAVNKLQDYVQ